MNTLTDFIYETVKDKDEAHIIDQKIRNALSPYLSKKEDLRNLLFGDAVRGFHLGGNRCFKKDCDKDHFEF